MKNPRQVSQAITARVTWLVFEALPGEINYFVAFVPLPGTTARLLRVPFRFWENRSLAIANHLSGLVHPQGGRTRFEGLEFKQVHEQVNRWTSGTKRVIDQGLKRTIAVRILISFKSKFLNLCAGVTHPRTCSNAYIIPARRTPKPSSTNLY